MKKLSFLFLSLLLIGIVSCKKETVDVTGLLKTIPSSTAGVVVFNMEDMLKDAGCKIKGHEIIPGDEIKNFCNKNSSQQQNKLMTLFEGNSGIEPKGAVIFYDSNRAFLTFALYDETKFTELIEKNYGYTFTNAGSGVKIGGNVAVKGGQAWICLTPGKKIDSDAIVSYSTLASSQSILVTPIGERLLADEEDVRGWALLDTFLNNILNRTDRGIFTLGLGFLFENPESVRFSMDFKKGEWEADAIILNDKGKPAKYLLPSEKTDIKILKSLGSTCDAMMTFTVTPKLIKKFDKLGESFGGALFGNLEETFKNVDGTVGVVTGSAGVNESLRGVVTTKGEVSTALKDMISTEMGEIGMDGNLLKFSHGDVKGNLTVEECAEALKGCCLGVIVDNEGIKNLGYGWSLPEGFQKLVMKCEPESGSLEFKLEVTTTDNKENALITFLK